MSSPRTVSVALLTGFAATIFFVDPAMEPGAVALAQNSQAGATGQATPTHEQGPVMRIPRQQASSTAAVDGVVRSSTATGVDTPVPGAVVTLRNLQTGQTYRSSTNGEGLFRIFPSPPGHYELNVESAGAESFVLHDLELLPNEVVTLEISVAAAGPAESASRLPRLPELGPAPTAIPPATLGTYRELRHRLDSDPAYIQELAPDYLPPVADVYNAVPNRWALTQPDYRRYPQGGEYIYTRSRWYDPFNRNRYKGDEPIWPKALGQQTFLNITATAETFFDGRRVPSPSNESSERPGSSTFFGKGEQGFFDQTFRFTFDLFHGDASFKPIDWRIRITPEISLNDLAVRERGIISPDVRAGTNRFDTHVGLQEAFVEIKLHDLSSNFDFVSARAGIQQFNADFRGFLFVDEQPGLRIFGNLHSDRIEYNAAYFNLLEKNTNSGLNTVFDRRHQQVVLGNVYLQDFFFPGYTAEFIGAFNKDDPSLHYDDNGFLVRPAPIGSVINQGDGLSWLARRWAHRAREFDARVLSSAGRRHF
jgi:carboxypeptidase family protein